jgi:hypothetical protein
MRYQDYLPSKEAEFLQWTKSFITYLGASAERFGFPKDLYDALAAQQQDFTEKYIAAEDPSTRTRISVQKKAMARIEFKKALRQAVREYLANNHLVNNADRDGLGIPIRKTSRTPSPVAKTYPDCDIDCSVIRRLSIHFYDQGSTRSKAKPAGQHGAEIRWAISNTPIVDIKDLVNSAFDTCTPFTLNFEGHERGQTVYFSLCWENTRGEKGPWSIVMSAIIP